jgi:hypothetical protein
VGGENVLLVSSGLKDLGPSRRCCDHGEGMVGE